MTASFHDRFFNRHRISSIFLRIFYAKLSKNMKGITNKFCLRSLKKFVRKLWQHYEKNCQRKLRIFSVTRSKTTNWLNELLFLTIIEILLECILNDQI